jgi:uncharacterized membrane protein
VLNRVDAGDQWDKYGWAAPVAIFALCAAIYVTAPRAATGAVGPVSDADVMVLMQKHCTTCHARRPTHESFKEPPKHVTLESVAELRQYARLVLLQAVQNKAMPLGNETRMTEEERARLGHWIGQKR